MMKRKNKSIMKKEIADINETNLSAILEFFFYSMKKTHSSLWLP